jgi:hypothetical protein
MKRMRVTRRRVLELIGIAAGCGLGGAATLLLRLPASITVIQPEHPTPSDLPIVPREAWGARSPNHAARNELGFYAPQNPFGWRDYGDAYPDIYRTLVVHHSVIYRLDDRTTLHDVQNLHMDDREWADVGYHFLVGQDGQIYEGRSLRVRGVHVGGFNTGSVGVCLLGDFTSSEPPAAQLDGLLRLGRWLMAQLPLTHLAGHREFNSDTQCPGARLYALLDALAQELGLQRGTGGYQAPT